MGAFSSSSKNTAERLAGVVERVTFHSPETGWSVLKVMPFDTPGRMVAVRVHQAHVVAGASMEFYGHWRVHPKYGEQFEAHEALERKPATAAALEKYLGSGLIRGVGPKTAHKIVAYFGDATLTVFEDQIDRLMEVPGIAAAKLDSIKTSWQEHRAVRDVMLFLQTYGVSTLFAVKIYKQYGDSAIAVVQRNPYQLARDIFGIGFFSADRIALALGFARDGHERIEAGIKHVLAASREEGHCYLTREQIHVNVLALLQIDPKESAYRDGIEAALQRLLEQSEVRTRSDNGDSPLYYSPTLYREENHVAGWVRRRMDVRAAVDGERVQRWLERYSASQGLQLSAQQQQAVATIVGCSFSILTGGPGCGKTTTTRALVRLLLAMGKNVLLAAPTGRAAQRMMEVIGREAKTIHRLLEWDPRAAGFKRNAESPLQVDFVIVDEASMLDISLASSLLDAVPKRAQVLLIGDPNQLPSVGAGNVLHDLLASPHVPRCALTQVFRQAQQSLIVQIAHGINEGVKPKIISPLMDRSVWTSGVDCVFVDAEEATQAELQFVRRAKAVIQRTLGEGHAHHLTTAEGEAVGMMVREGDRIRVEDERGESGIHGANASVDTDPPGPGVNGTELASASPMESSFVIPRKFLHVNLERLAEQKDAVAELATVLRRIHPYSALRLGMSATDVVRRLYTDTLRKQINAREIQILTPMNRGSLGAHALNGVIQEAFNPPSVERAELRLGDRLFRVGDRVIQRRNNYDHNVFNGDIGEITAIDAEEGTCTVRFGVVAGAVNPHQPVPGVAGGSGVSVGSGGSGGPGAPGGLGGGGGSMGSRGSKAMITTADAHVVTYAREDVVELALAYAITIHKSQGSEFEAVIIPVVSQHFKMLFRNLIYTGLTRAKRMAVFVGSRYALEVAIDNIDTRQRQTALTALLDAVD